MNLLVRNFFFLSLITSLSAIGQARKTALCVDCSKGDNVGTLQANYFQSNLMNKYDVKYLKLDITVLPNNRFISGSSFYRIKTKQPLDTLAIEFKQTMNVDSIYVNNTKRTYTR